MTKKFKLLVLTLIILTSFFLRFVNLEKVPDGFQEDEVSLGYNAYSILKTGKDENNNRFPLYVDTFGDFRPALHFYLIAPSVAVFGNTIFAVRLVSALLGALTPLAVYLLVKKVKEDKDEKLPILSSFLVAISPWHINLSRASNDAVVALFFLLFGLYLFADYLFQKRKLSLIGSLILFFLSINSYHTPRVLIPLLLIMTVLFFKSKWIGNKISRFLIPLSIMITIGLTVLMLLLIKGGTGRFSQVSIFTTPDEKLIIDEQIREDQNFPPITTRLTHNKIINYSLRFMSNYSQYFTLDYLGIKGGLPLWYLIPQMGLIYIFEVPFLLIGLYKILSKIRTNLFWLFFLLLAPVVAATTLDDIPNIQRSLFMVPALQVLTAIGLISNYSFLKEKKIINRRIFFTVFLIFFIANFYYFSHQYYHHSSVHKTWHRQNGIVELSLKLPKYQDKYSKIVVSEALGPVHNYLLYFNKIDPDYFRSTSPQIRKGTWTFENYEFTPGDCPIDGRKNILVICRGEWKTPLAWKTVETIYRTDKTPAFRFLVRESEVNQ